ncbi:MAG: hypothetical protein ACE5E9_06915 [Nitrospinaceae bacterium]
MPIYQTTSIKPLPLQNRIFLILGIIVTLCLLFFFAFTVFMIALLAGAVLSIVGFIQRARWRTRTSNHPSSQPKPYREPHSRDDDVIDV